MLDARRNIGTTSAAKGTGLTEDGSACRGSGVPDQPAAPGKVSTPSLLQTLVHQSPWSQHVALRVE